MTFLSPWFLLALVPVAAAAAWAIFRPARKLTVVSSLSLWREALDALARPMRRRARRLTAAWLLLLAGALAAVLAAAQPVYVATKPFRRVAIAVYPSIELGGREHSRELQSAVGGLLDRLSKADKALLVLPDLLGGAGGGWLSVEDARARVREVELLPVPAEKLAVPQVAADAQHTYRFAPAGMGWKSAPRVSSVGLETPLRPVTIDAMDTAGLPDGRVRLFVALRNQTGSPQGGRLRVGVIAADGAPAAAFERPFSLPGGARIGVSRDLAAAAAVFAEVQAADGSAGGPGGRAFVVPREADTRKIAMLGRDEPLLRRFVAVHRGLEVTGEVDLADAVIANGVDPPSGKPALVVDPPTSPPGWRRGEAVEAVVLDKLSVPAEAILSSVDLSGVAVRSVRPWVPVAGAWDESLARGREGAFILKLGAGRAGGARRVYVAFDLSEPNTNFGTLPDFVVFLAGAMGYLLGGLEELNHTPLQAGSNLPWRQVYPAPRPDQAGPLLWPGIYRDGAGKLHAVSVTGLRAARPEAPAQEAVAALPIPPPEFAESGLALWPVLAAAAGLLWILGWAARLS